MTSKAAQERFKAQQAAKTLPEKETYSAKQAAMRLATDARTFRKFLRSSHCTFEAVGQGKRYEFTHEELMTLRDEFIEWREYCEARRTTDRSEPRLQVVKATTEFAAEVAAIKFEAPSEEELDDLWDSPEPTEAQLMDLDAIMEGFDDDEV